MAATQTEIESRAVELSAEAFEAFCEDIAGMFVVDMECTQQEVTTETIKGLKKCFKKKLAAINFVKAEGALNGNFQLIFDQGGLFTLSGIIVMQPENRILEEIKRGSIKDVDSVNDAVKEAGNMLVGSWDRVFREELEGHGHFVQTSTFVGDPWDKPNEKIGIAEDQEFIFVPYKMTIGSYPTFNCGVIFPKAIFGGKAEAQTEEESGKETEEKTAVEKGGDKETETTTESEHEQAKPEQPAEAQAPATEEDTKAAETEKAASAEQTDAEKETEQKVKEETKQEVKEETNQEPEATAEGKTEDKAEEKTEDKSGPEEKTSDEGSTKEEPQAAAEEKSDDVDTDVTDKAAEEKDVTTARSGEQPVSETIQKMTQSAAVLPGEAGYISSAVSARDIMEKDIVWGSPDDSVQHALAEMQQADVGYMMIGTDSVPEGIVSKSDIAGAMSPYLRPVFAKWRRPLDDASLNIKLKWIMSRPVHTIKPDTSVTAIIENMRQSGNRCLPVTDEQGKVQGLVTVFDIFKVLNSSPDVSSTDKSVQASPSA